MNLLIICCMEHFWFFKQASTFKRVNFWVEHFPFVFFLWPLGRSLSFPIRGRANRFLFPFEVFCVSLQSCLTLFVWVLVDRVPIRVERVWVYDWAKG